MIMLVGDDDHDDDDDKCNDGHDDDNCNDDDDDDDDDDDCLSPRELEGSREVRKSEEEVFSPAEDDHYLNNHDNQSS